LPPGRRGGPARGPVMGGISLMGLPGAFARIWHYRVESANLLFPKWVDRLANTMKKNTKMSLSLN
jgi:hypothetical protein